MFKSRRILLLKGILNDNGRSSGWSGEPQKKKYLTINVFPLILVMPFAAAGSRFRKT